MPSGVYIRTEQTRKNMSIAFKGRTAWNKGKTGIYSKETLKNIGDHCPWKGKKNPQLSEANRKRIYDAKKRKEMSERQKGEKGSNWQGGIAPMNNAERHCIEMKLWREAVFARDNWTCLICGKRGPIQAHHLKEFSKYPELRYAIDNGITLCIPCHKETDNYGRKK